MAIRMVQPGNIIVRQRGTRIHQIKCGMGKDHSIFSLIISFSLSEGFCKNNVDPVPLNLSFSNVLFGNWSLRGHKNL